MKDLKVLGIMSGTSLDGVDLALCRFKEYNSAISYEILRAETIAYDPDWKHKLRALETASAAELAQAHSLYGEYLGKLSRDFLTNEKVDLISSHGHTIFHQPDKKFTWQLGSGAAIAAVSGFPVVCDFRSKDVALSGQGAPLVPIGDELLFNEYSYCLNLGGIANISFREKDKRIAFDICPVNLILNEIAVEVDLPYDGEGRLASSGILIGQLFHELNELDYYKFDNPKSLGREYVVEVVLPLIKTYKEHSVQDRLHTVVHHIAHQIALSAPFQKDDRMLVTGGGAYNDYLILQVKKKVECEVVIPSNMIVEFKEALIFAFLGMLRWEGRINTLKAVTGAAGDSCGGCIYL